jgi:AcrR family transcriptional regulator
MVEEMAGRRRRGHGRPPAGPERRDSLVAAAFAVIAREGFEGLRMRGVAANAGLDHSTVHHYFASKEELIEAVVADATGRFRSTTPAAGTGAERLRAHLDALATRIVAEPELHIVLRECLPAQLWDLLVHTAGDPGPGMNVFTQRMRHLMREPGQSDPDPVKGAHAVSRAVFAD